MSINTFYGIVSKGVQHRPRTFRIHVQSHNDMCRLLAHKNAYVHADVWGGDMWKSNYGVSEYNDNKMERMFK